MGGRIGFASWGNGQRPPVRRARVLTSSTSSLPNICSSSLRDLYSALRGDKQSAPYVRKEGRQIGSSYKKIQKRSSSVNGETGRTYYVQWSGNLFQALMSSPQAPEPEVDFPWAANDQAIRFRSLLRCYNFPYHFLMHHSIISHPVPAFYLFRCRILFCSYSKYYYSRGYRTWNETIRWYTIYGDLSGPGRRRGGI